jgi:hypothetical protein
MKPETEEKRSHTRVQFSTRVVVKTLDEEVFRAQADTRDISLQSAYLRTRRKPPINRYCELEIGAGPAPPIRLKGRVVRHDGDGVAIIFEGVAMEPYFRLKELLLSCAADPDAIVREAPL